MLGVTVWGFTQSRPRLRSPYNRGLYALPFVPAPPSTNTSLVVAAMPEPASGPMKMLREPVVVDEPAWNPSATFPRPVVSARRASAPTATFESPVVAFIIAYAPMAVFMRPVERFSA